MHLCNTSDTLPSTVTNYRYTNYIYTTAMPTKLAGCGTTQALAAPLAAASPGLILTKVAGAGPTAAPLMLRHQGKCESCPPVKDGIKTACSCFFPSGPPQTIIQTQTVATGTIYSTTTSTTNVYIFRTRTIAGA